MARRILSPLHPDKTRQDRMPVAERTRVRNAGVPMTHALTSPSRHPLTGKTTGDFWRPIERL